MDRREVLKWLGGSAAMAGLPAFGAEWIENRFVLQSGARKPKRARPDRKHFHQTFSPFKGISGAVDKNVFLFDHLRKEIGEIVPHDQSTIIDTEGRTVRVGEGDCVGQAMAMCCDVLAATEIHMLGEPERFVAKASVEMMYAGSRIEIGKLGRPEKNPNERNFLVGRGGSQGEWAARFVNEYGVLHRTKYKKGDNEIDLTGYSPARSRQYRDGGVPDWLEPIAKEHPVLEITNVTTAQEALDAVCAGQPVIMCCSYAFKNERDKDGFADPYLGMGWVREQNGWGRWFRRWTRLVQWWHAQALTGAILKGPRKGGVIQNSHGDWNDGPNPLNLPRGAYGVDFDVLDMMVKDWFDCYAIAAYKGHQAERMKRKIQLYLR